jgi:hypothetical protein
MPVYQYKGQYYELSETDPAAAKAKILSHLGEQAPAAPVSPPQTLAAQAGLDQRPFTPAGFMLRPEFVEQVRSEYGNLPPEQRRTALQEASMGRGVRADAAKRILADLAVEDQRRREVTQGREGLMGILAAAQQQPAPRQPAAPAGPAPRVQFPDVSPTIGDIMDMVPEQERIQRRLAQDEAARTLEAAESSIEATRAREQERMGGVEQLIESLKIGGEQAKSGALGLTAVAQQAQMAKVGDQLKELEAQGQGNTPQADRLRKVLEHYSSRQQVYLGDLAQTQAKLSTAPVYKGVRELTEAETFTDAAKAFARNPVSIVMNLTAQSLPSMLPALVLGVINPALGVAAMGGSSYGVEFGNELLGFAREKGFDTTNPQQMAQFMQNSELLREGVNRAGTKAGIVAAGDMLLTGLAAKTLVPKRITGPVAKNVTNVGAQMGVQSVGGAGTEALAQYITTGEIKPGEVVAEAVGELGGAPAEVLSQTAQARREARAAQQAAAPTAEPPAAAPAAPVPPAPPAAPAVEPERVAGLFEQLAKESQLPPAEAPAAPAEAPVQEAAPVALSVEQPPAAPAPVAEQPPVAPPAVEPPAAPPAAEMKVEPGKPFTRPQLPPQGPKPPELDEANVQRSKKPPEQGGRHPQVQAAAMLLEQGKMSREEYEKYVEHYRPIYPIDIDKLVAPSTEEAMRGALRGPVAKSRLNKPIEDGTRVGLRMDLPALDKGVPVVSIHEGKPNNDPRTGKAYKEAGDVFSYSNTGYIKDVFFAPRDQTASLRMGYMPQGKNPLQTAEGVWSNKSPEEVFSEVQRLKDNPAWTQVGFDPHRHGYFYDRKTREPVASADELYQVGNFLLAKNVKYAPKSDYLYSLRSPIGLYSELENKIEGVSVKQAPAAQWKAMINALPQKGVKPEEIESSGVNDWLDLQTGKVSKEDLLNYLQQGGVRVEETQLGGKVPAEYKKEYDRITDLRDRGGQISTDEWRRRIAKLNEQYGFDKDASPFDAVRTKYKQYSLPGGENYREVLLTLPGEARSWEEARDDAVKKWAGADASNYDGLSNEKREAFDKLFGSAEDFQRREGKKPTPKGAYRSPHWDQPNVLAHIRVNDRTDADGKKVLFVEEIQSDWGQQGKKEGFAVREARPKPTSFEVRESDGGFRGYWNNGDVSGLFETRERAQADLQRYLDSGRVQNEMKGVPAAPFVTKTEGWLNLALKRIITMAAEGGYDRVAFVTGEQSADRYDLSKQVDSIVYTKEDDGTYSLVALKDNREVVERENVAKSALPDLVGKEVAERIVNGEGKALVGGPERELFGDNLKVGGEGMKAFYDNIVPAALKKLLPKVGGEKMIGVELPVGGRETGFVSGKDVMDYLGIPKEDQYQYWNNLGSDGRDKAIADYRNRNLTPAQQPGFDVTPAMREKVQTTGLPKFSKRGEKRSAKQVKSLEQDLRKALDKFGLGEVGVKLAKGMREEASYAAKIIKIAADSANPIRALRHETIHALRDLGFFTPGQWQALSKMAKDKWIDTYLKDRNVDGEPRKAGEESRYAAYMREYNGDMEKITEEAVADAFADFDATNKPPAGMVAAVLKRLRNFFKAIKSAITKVESPEQIFGKIEEGKVRPPAPPRPLKERLRNNWIVMEDELGRLKLTPGAVAYRVGANIANNVLDRVGLKPVSPELGRAMRNMRVKVENVQKTSATLAQELAKMSPQERELISDVIEGELKAGVQPPENVLNFAAAMQELMKRQSDELVRLGMLSKEAAQRWEYKYLPRFYLSKLKDDVNAWAKAAKNLIRRQPTMQGVVGKNLKARGLFETIPVEDLQDWIDLGYEQRDPGFDPKTSTETVVWRDYTREERENMGEIRDAMFRFVMGYNASQRDIALGRLYEELADSYASKGPKEGFVQVPDTKVEGTGAYRYGKLAGMYVPNEIMDHLVHNDKELANGALKIYRAALSRWKEGKTVLNPVAHANNVISNLTMAHFAGVSYWDAQKYAGAVKDIVTNADMLKEADEVGLFSGSFSQSELVASMPPELQAMANMTESQVAKLGERLWDLLSYTVEYKGRKIGVRPMAQWMYENEDSFFRFLIYRDARNRGLDPQDARDYSQSFIFTYDDLPRGARALRDFAMPFFAYTYKVIPVLTRTALEYPWRYAAPATIAYSVNAMMYAMAAGLGEDEDDWWGNVLYKYATDPEFRAKAKELEQQERRNLPPWLKGESAALGAPKAIRLGMDDVTGMPLFIDTSRIFPGADLLDAVNNSGGVALLQPLTPSNPVLTTLVAMLANKDMFFGKDVVKASDTEEEKTQKRLAWLWKQAAPAIAVGNYHFDRGMNVIANITGKPITIDAGPMGVVDYTGVGKDGLPVIPKYAALQTMGIKVRPYDLEVSEKIEESKQNQLIRELALEISRIDRLEKKGAISTEAAVLLKSKAEEKQQLLRDGLTIEGKPRE